MSPVSDHFKMSAHDSGALDICCHLERLCMKPNGTRMG